ncbi:MAG: cytochrome c oxidase subunit 3 [Candidatus Cyclobacteriaceae bacterium M2_1C_046]
MVSEMKMIEKPQKSLSMHPKKFALWLFMMASVMLFAAFTSAYIVRQSEGNWAYFDLPVEFYLTTVILILSSLTMQWSLNNAKKDEIDNVKKGLVVTIILGLIFLAGQYYIWKILVDHEVFFVGNPSGSFLYVLTGIHGVHLISGLIFLAVTYIKTAKLEVHSKKLSTIEMCNTYWHFLDGLWIYLLIFLLLNHN